MDKEKIVRFARTLAETMMLRDGIPFYAGCLYYAIALRITLHLEGGVPTKDVILQAGTMSWPRMNADQDDGKETTLTHFTYLFDPAAPETVQALVEGRLPELHAWVACKNQNDQQWHLIDLTTCYLPERTRHAGLTWYGDMPPYYLWRPLTNMPPRVSYQPDRTALWIVNAAAEDIVRRFV